MAYCKESSKKYYLKNRERLLALKKVRYENDPQFKERVKNRASIQITPNGYMVDYYATNKKYFSDYAKERYNTNPQHKLAVQMRNRFNELLKKQTTKKNNSVMKYLGCGLDEYKLYIESKFEEEMNWDNQGDVWELDHIKPCDSFDFSKEEEIFKCFNFKNVEPLFKTTLIAESLGYEGYIGNRNKTNH